MGDDLTLQPESVVRRVLGDLPVTLRVIRPPYPALGVGALRVLRMRDVDGALAIDAGYDNYERLN